MAIRSAKHVYKYDYDNYFFLFIHFLEETKYNYIVVFVE